MILHLGYELIENNKFSYRTVAYNENCNNKEKKFSINPDCSISDNYMPRPVKEKLKKKNLLISRKNDRAVLKQVH